MRLIVLNAGDSFKLDGFNKLLLKNPETNNTIIEEYEEKYKIKDIDIVVGFNAIPLMNKFPKYNYIYNSKWQITSNSYSLALALSYEPTIVTSSDFFISDKLIKEMNKFENCVVIKDHDNKNLSALNVNIKNNKIIRIYKGKSLGLDLELLGIFKISDENILKQWKKNCLLNPEKYVGENLPFLEKINIIKVSNEDVYEINELQDFINFLSIKRVK